MLTPMNKDAGTNDEDEDTVGGLTAHRWLAGARLPAELRPPLQTVVACALRFGAHLVPPMAEGLECVMGGTAWQCRARHVLQ